MEFKSVFNVKIEYFNSLKGSKSAPDRNKKVTCFSLRMLDKKSPRLLEFRLTASNYLELFITNSIEVLSFDQQFLVIWIPSYKCRITSTSPLQRTENECIIEDFRIQVQRMIKVLNDPVTISVIPLLSPSNCHIRKKRIRSPGSSNKKKKHKDQFCSLSARKMLKQYLSSQKKKGNDIEFKLRTNDQEVKNLFGSGSNNNSPSKTKTTYSKKTPEKFRIRKVNTSPCHRSMSGTSFPLSSRDEQKDDNKNVSLRNNESTEIVTMGLTTEQEYILESVKLKKSIFYSGGAGTGKSSLLPQIIQALLTMYSKDTVFITATTGLAACTIGGTTIHQFAGIGIVEDSIKEQDIEMMINKTCSIHSVLNRWRQTKALIIDEISMLDPRLLGILNRIAQKTRSSIKPMGGIQLIVCGDFFQLPPVRKEQSYFNTFNKTSRVVDEGNKENIRPGNGSSSGQSNRFCFQSPLWKQLFDVSVILSRVFRQAKDEEFVRLLNELRWGRFEAEMVNLLQNCVGRNLDCSDSILPTQIFTHKKDVDDLNKIQLQELPGEKISFLSSDTGEGVFVKMLQSHCQAKQQLQLKIGAQVMLIKTTESMDGLVNGARGVIIRFTHDLKNPIVRFTGNIERIIYNANFTISMGGKIVAMRSQLPLDLAWGISVHKSQGMTVDKAIIHLKHCFEVGQAYVALSRVRSLKGLCLTVPLSSHNVKAHPDVITFYEHLIKSK